MMLGWIRAGISVRRREMLFAAMAYDKGDSTILSIIPRSSPGQMLK